MDEDQNQDQSQENQDQNQDQGNQEDNNNQGSEENKGTQTASDTGVDEEFKFEDDNSAPPIKETKPNSDDQGGQGDDDDDARVEKIVKKVVSPLLETHTQAQVNSQIQDILTQYPEAKGLESKIRRWATTPGSVYEGNPRAAFKEIAGEDFFIKVGAKRASKAKAAADDDKGNGGSTSATRPADNSNNNNGTQIPNMKGKSFAEINKMINDVKAGRYNQGS